ncbi:MAG: glycosyltransferase [Fimbriimonas sp.]
MSARIVLLTGSLPPNDVCGVGDYTFRLYEALQAHLPVDALRVPIDGWREPALFRAFEGRDLVHVQYPTEGWGKSVLPGLLGLRKRGAKLLVTLHEWSAMNGLRRRSLGPLLRAADGFVFVTPFERDAFLASHPRLAGKPMWVVPIGVNLTVPKVSEAEVRAHREAQLEGGFDFLLTHFGFVHPGKQPEKLLETLWYLKDQGKRPLLLMIGGFKKGRREGDKDFLLSALFKGLYENVKLLGFVHDDYLAAALMAAADANVSLFADGLSSRRGSFWYAAQHGNPLVTTEPHDPREFEAVEDRLRLPHVRFVAPDASPEAIAEALGALPEYAPFRFEPIPAPCWEDIAVAHAEIYRIMLSP